MRPTVFAVLVSTMLFGLATPSFAQTVVAANSPAGAAGMTIVDGSDAGPAPQPVVVDQAEDVSDVSALPTIATHAPTSLSALVKAGNSN